MRHVNNRFGSVTCKTDTSKVTPKLSVSHNIRNNATVQIVRDRNDQLILVKYLVNCANF